MKSKKKIDTREINQKEYIETYQYMGQTDAEIILKMNKRKEVNQALKKLLDNLNANSVNIESKKNV